MVDAALVFWCGRCSDRCALDAAEATARDMHRCQHCGEPLRRVQGPAAYRMHQDHELQKSVWCLTTPEECAGLLGRGGSRREGSWAVAEAGGDPCVVHLITSRAAHLLRAPAPSPAPAPEAPPAPGAEAVPMTRKRPREPADGGEPPSQRGPRPAQAEGAQHTAKPAEQPPQPPPPQPVPPPAPPVPPGAGPPKPHPPLPQQPALEPPQAPQQRRQPEALQPQMWLAPLVPRPSRTAAEAVRRGTAHRGPSGCAPPPAGSASPVTPQPEALPATPTAAPPAEGDPAPRQDGDAEQPTESLLAVKLEQLPGVRSPAACSQLSFDSACVIVNYLPAPQKGTRVRAQDPVPAPAAQPRLPAAQGAAAPGTPQLVPLPAPQVSQPAAVVPVAPPAAAPAPVAAPAEDEDDQLVRKRPRRRRGRQEPDPQAALPEARSAPGPAAGRQAAAAAAAKRPPWHRLGGATPPQHTVEPATSRVGRWIDENTECPPHRSAADCASCGTAHPFRAACQPCLDCVFSGETLQLWLGTSASYADGPITQDMVAIWNDKGVIIETARLAREVRMPYQTEAARRLQEAARQHARTARTAAAARQQRPRGAAGGELQGGGESCTYTRLTGESSLAIGDVALDTRRPVPGGDFWMLPYAIGTLRAPVRTAAGTLRAGTRVCVSPRPSASRGTIAVQALAAGQPVGPSGEVRPDRLSRVLCTADDDNVLPGSEVMLLIPEHHPAGPRAVLAQFLIFDGNKQCIINFLDTCTSEAVPSLWDPEFLVLLARADADSLLDGGQ